MRTANHASPAKGIRKTKLQGSDAQSSKTLQSQNSLQEKKRFQLNRLTVLHDRLAKPILFPQTKRWVSRRAQPIPTTPFTCVSARGDGRPRRPGFVISPPI